MNEYERHYLLLQELLGGEECRVIHNKPHRPLTVEQFVGQPLISVCFYGRHNEDRMRDPEVVFRIADESAKPIYFRNDFTPTALVTLESHARGSVQLVRQADMDSFSRKWLAAIEDQGYVLRAREVTARKAASRAVGDPANEPVPDPEPDNGPEMGP